MQPGALFNPFPGLRPFEPDENHLFFGREEQVDELLRRLRTTRFLSVTGTSGSGKSSLVRCGLGPALESGFMVTAGSSWRIATFRPGEDPIAAMAAALDAPEVLGSKGELASTNRVLLEATLRRGALGLVDAVRQARMPPEANLLVVVDQFEELFRFQRSRQSAAARDEAAAFVKLLLEASRRSDAPVYVVLTMRSDFIGDCMEYAGLPEAVNAGQYLVPRLTRSQLRSAITGPVAVAGGGIAPRLVLRLLNDLGDDRDQLPVLQHALMRTWDHWQRYGPQGAPIDIPDYEAVGTLRNALSLHAEEAFRECAGERLQKIAERLFKALTDRVSDPRGVRRPASLQAAAAVSSASETEVAAVVEVFRAPGRCFLMPPAGTRLEPHSILDLSHESLMRCWTRLIGWAEEERAAAEAYVRLSRAAQWFEEGTGGLWRNPELQFALDWKRQTQPTAAWARRYDPSFDRAMGFLARSEQERDRLEAEKEKERKRKLRLAWGTACVLGALLLAALWQGYQARIQRARAETNLRAAQQAVDESLSAAGRRQARQAADVPQLEEFRRELLEKAQAFYSSLAAREPDNAELRKSTAWAHARLGDIHRLTGKHEAAVKEYGLAIEQFQGLARELPGDRDCRQALAYAHNWLAETLRASWEAADLPAEADAQGARTHYEGALRLQQELSQDAPEHAGYRQELARTRYNRGILNYDRNQFDDSESDFREAIRLLEPLGRNPGPASGPQPAQELARACNNLANLLMSRGMRLQEAHDLFGRAIGISEGLTAGDPANREYKVELAQYYGNLAILLEYQDEPAEAKRRNQQALDLIEDLSRPAPSLSLERAKAQLLRGIILKSEGSPGAGQAFDLTLQLLEEMQRAGSSGDTRHLHDLYSDLGDYYAERAQAGLKSGRPGEARDAMTSLARVLKQLPPADVDRLQKSYPAVHQELQKIPGNRRK